MYNFFNINKKIYLLLPFEKIGVLGLTYQSGTHHDCLETLSFNGPQFTLGYGSYGGCALAVIENGQLAQDLGTGQGGQIFALT